MVNYSMKHQKHNANFAQHMMQHVADYKLTMVVSIHLKYRLVLFIQEKQEIDAYTKVGTWLGLYSTHVCFML